MTAYNHIYFLKNNEYSKSPFEYENAFYIFKVYEKQAEKTASFEESRDKVISEKRKLKEQEIMNQYLEKLKEKYKVIVHYGKLPAVNQENKVKK